jgi:hypothetical protein
LRDQFLGTHGRVTVSGSYVYSKPQGSRSFHGLAEVADVPSATTTRWCQPRRNLYLRAAIASFDNRSTIFGIEDTTDRLHGAGRPHTGRRRRH